MVVVANEFLTEKKVEELAEKREKKSEQREINVPTILK